ncbi:MAG: DUF2807 domain-containing protein [Prolixibacteraceae bacterium]|nr:DUF2807 domain-containing protein [Prolixibacteraceae bacterium]
MKTFTKSFALLVLIATMSACYFGPHPSIVGSGPIVNQEFTVTDFDAVAGETVIDIEIAQGDVQSVVAEGHENMMAFLDLRVINNKLRVDLKNGSYRNFQMKIYVTVPELKSVEVESTGSITVEEFTPMNSFYLSCNSTGNLRCNGYFTIEDALTIHSRSTGNITIGADAKTIDVSQTSTGNINISGACDKQFVDMDGTGQYRAYDLLSKECRIYNDGTGNANLFVTDMLDVTIASTGNVFYKGNPEVYLNDTSVGDLISVN